MSSASAQKVAVLGASDKPHRYAYLAAAKLIEHGHQVYPIHPTLSGVLGLTVFPSLAQCPPVDTLTLYVGSAKLPSMVDEIISARPGRVLFNPGTENSEVQQALDAAGIPWLEACTLVLLATGQF
jgi:uncharacterized protein